MGLVISGVAVALTVNKTGQIGRVIGIDVSALITLILHLLVVPLDVEVVGRRPLHGKAVVENVVLAHVFFERSVVDPAVILDLSAEQFHAQLVFDEWYVDDTFDVLTTVLIDRQTDVATPFHGDVTADDVDQAAGGVLAKQGALGATEDLDALDIEVLHQHAARSAKEHTVQDHTNGWI